MQGKLIGRRALFVIALGAAIGVAMPWLGGLLVKPFVLSKARARLGRPVHAARCRLGWMRVVLKDVEVEGLGRIDRIEASSATIRLIRPHLAIEREVLDQMLDRKGAKKPAAEADAEAKGGRRLVVEEGALGFEDRKLGITLRIARFSADLVGRSGQVKLEGLEARHALGAAVRAERIEAELARGKPGAVAIRGGEVHLWKGLALTGIEGAVLPKMALGGGYGGVPGELWRARGTIDYESRRADVVVDAQKFTLDKLAPLLREMPLVMDPAKATVSGRLDIGAREGRIGVQGQLQLTGLDIGLRQMGKPVRDLALSVRLAGAAMPAERRLELHQLVLEHQGVQAVLTGEYDISGPRPKLDARLRVPQVPCQKVLEALPRPLVPAIADFKLAGDFAADVWTNIDWNDLEALELGGNVGINGCKVLFAPPDLSADKLLGAFEHRVELEAGHDIDFVVGPQNPDWAPWKDISPHIVNSLMTTEDNGFFRHRGFITREFRSALIQNLERGYFRLGASSITMQMVKNVLLSREKTLSRKLQEMFLTWYLESRLPKERIFEIYLNVIEFGPGIYGIGRAMRHYFGKSVHDASPREAAFFSSILPSPKRRYAHYCRGQLSEKWEQYLNRILKKMYERDRLTDSEYLAATSHQLAFDRKEAMPERECMAWIARLTRSAPVDNESDLRASFSPDPGGRTRAVPAPGRSGLKVR